MQEHNLVFFLNLVSGFLAVYHEQLEATKSHIKMIHAVMQNIQKQFLQKVVCDHVENFRKIF